MEEVSGLVGLEAAAVARFLIKGGHVVQSRARQLFSIYLGDFGFAVNQFGSNCMSPGKNAADTRPKALAERPICRCF
ncbi:MAG: hypothetical protein AAFZ99_20660 [Pseudomonadota bacterium]